MNFKEIYKKTQKDKKLNFLTQLLEKDTSLQEQFIAFTKEGDLDKITGVDIDTLRDKIWKELSYLDTDEIMEERFSYRDYYDDEGDTGYEILDDLFKPYLQQSLDYLDKGNYLDAFRVILAIYEVKTLEAPDVEDENYYVFGDDIESYIETTISNCFADFNESLATKVVSTDMAEFLINLLFERYLANEAYRLYHFSYFVEVLINEKSKAQYLLNIINEHDFYSDESATIVIHIAKVLEDDTLFLNVANEFYSGNSDISIELLKKYKALKQDDDFARIAKILLAKENSYLYTLLIIEHINHGLYQALYVKALKLYISSERSMEHYKLLREYLDDSERLAFIQTFKNIYRQPFYIKLLALEEQYPMILEFVQKHNDSYELREMLEPIVSVYPDEVFEITLRHCDKLIAERGRGNYHRASQLLSLLLNTPSKREALTNYVQKVYNHKPNLPALKDELRKAGVV